MSQENVVILITGPSGCGKSTIARKLSNNLRCVDIDIETINYMLVDGFKEKSDGTLDFIKWGVSGDTIGRLVQIFKNKGYGAIIHGHVTEDFIKILEKQIKVNSKVLILPSLDTVVRRDKERSAHLSMGEHMVTEHYKYFRGSLFRNFTILDSTNLSIDQTADKICS